MTESGPTRNPYLITTTQRVDQHLEGCRIDVRRNAVAQIKDMPRLRAISVAHTAHGARRGRGSYGEGLEFTPADRSV